MNEIEFTRIQNDVNGNPRVVCHYLNFLNKDDSYNNYALAVKRANKLGGSKYNTKLYGGGIVFQCYNTSSLEKEIIEFINQLEVDK